MVSIRNMIDRELPDHSTEDRGAAAVLDQIRAMLAGPPVSDPFDDMLETGLPVLSDLVDLDWGWQVPERFGSYRTEKCLGVGGTASVFLAHCSESGQAVAVKMLHSRDPRLVKRFQRERHILSGLSHENLTRVRDSGISACGFPWFAMDYVQGVPLDHWCDAWELSLRDRVLLFLKVCEAVTYAHRSHVIHRDIKPANILVGPNGHIHLLDFGIASVLDPDSGAQLTVSRLGLMTPEYASPEQSAGLPLTAATDIYSLGVVLFELLVGARPTPAASGQRRAKQSLVAQYLRHKDPERVALLRRCRPEDFTRELDGRLERVLRKALAPRPAERYRDVAELTADLRGWTQQRRKRSRAELLVQRLKCRVGRLGKKLGVMS